MNLQELEALVAGGESDQLEFKATTAELVKGFETLCGFANTKGGTVLFGVQPGGKITGQSVSDRTQQDVALEGRQIQARVPVEQELIPLANGQSVIAVTVPRGPDIPYICRGSPWERRGTVTDRMPQNVYQQLLLTRAHPRLRWENQPARGITVADLDANRLATQLAVKQLKTPSTELALELLGLLANGELTQAAVVLFAREKSFAPDYVQCGIELARFKGTTRVEFVDGPRHVRGNLFDVVDAAEAFLTRWVPVRRVITTKASQGVEHPAVPAIAVRELLRNALIHREYATTERVELSIFDDRLEITSPGPFPPRITSRMLLSGKPCSVPRNAGLVDALGLLGFIERYGTGLPRTLHACEEEGTPLPELSDADGAVHVVLRGDFGTTAVQVTVVSQQLLVVLRALSAAPLNRGALLRAAGLKDRVNFRVTYLNPLIEQGLITFVYPDAPNRPDQAYRLTDAGARSLAAADPSSTHQVPTKSTAATGPTKRPSSSPQARASRTSAKRAR